MIELDFTQTYELIESVSRLELFALRKLIRRRGTVSSRNRSKRELALMRKSSTLDKSTSRAFGPIFNRKLTITSVCTSRS